METYIAIIRGINVSGQKMIKMTDLKVSLENTGLENLSIYIQSGNLVFEHENMETNLISKKITDKIQHVFGFEVMAIVLPLKKIRSVFESNPFINNRKEDINYLYVTFLSGFPHREHLDKMINLDFKPDEFIISGDVVYVFCPNGYGRSKINNNFFENKLKLPATTRNWKTVKQLVEMGMNR